MSTLRYLVLYYNLEVINCIFVLYKPEGRENSYNNKKKIVKFFVQKILSRYTLYSASM